ncbi:MerR family transcriptional regulator [Agromyces sp. Leaf222]|uniref:MerR family transcriptional regulator n=1 Tax=Agromyces sp. Leaf222 TaxID=1735688 RepID=UPI0006F6E2D3|nr:MerR family transcriptional regulator [Agromyces sp. Leaf222]KQM81012.1 MerR family transcriptional regulator [Agromyces sp. Leaf222]
MDWSIQEIAKLAGTTSRTLRHYDDIGLLEPARIGSNGYRYYDAEALVRLQRIMLLRDLGLGLPAVADVLEREDRAPHALRSHLEWLLREQQRLARQIVSVERTIDALEGGERLMAEQMFDGFDHTEYKEEVEQRWGTDAYARSDAWWRSMSADEKRAWQGRLSELNADWIAAQERGIDPAGDEAQALAQRHFEWLRGIPGTPGGGAEGPSREYFLGLAEMYVADERFGANYGGADGARFVRDAMTAYAERNL